MSIMKLRVPRKKKKQFKKMWQNTAGKKVFIKRSSIEYKVWPVSEGKIVWGCETYFKIN